MPDMGYVQQAVKNMNSSSNGDCPNEDYYSEHGTCVGCPYFDKNDGREVFDGSTSCEPDGAGGA